MKTDPIYAVKRPACKIHRMPLTQRGLSNEETLATHVGLSLWRPLVAESCHLFLPIFGYLNVRFREKRTFTVYAKSAVNS